MTHSRLPVLFIPHGGGPCFFMDWTMGPKDTWDKTAAWFGQIPALVGVKPKSILLISGHWEETVFSVTTNSNPSLIYDYSGFPEHTYQIQYPAPGSPELAKTVYELLVSAGLPAALDSERGFDHGVFIPLKVAFPMADIPIVQLSLQAALDPATHIALGRILAPLREKGVLIIGSGMSYHNLRGFFGAGVKEASDVFDEWLTEAVCVEDPQFRNEKLAQWQIAPSARSAHPREEHLLPLMVVAGAADQDVGEKLFSDRVMGSTISAFGFGVKK